MNGAKKLSIIGCVMFFAFILVLSATNAIAGDVSDYDGYYEGEFECYGEDGETSTVYLWMAVDDGNITGEYNDTTGGFAELYGTVDADGNAMLTDDTGYPAHGTYHNEVFTFTNEERTFEMKLVDLDYDDDYDDYDVSDYNGHYEGEVEHEDDGETTTISIWMDVDDGDITGEWEDDDEAGEFYGTVDERGYAQIYDEETDDLLATGYYDDEDETFTLTDGYGNTIEMELVDEDSDSLSDICSSTFAMAIVGILALALIVVKR